MVSLTIEPADNGVVKTLYDDSINGAGEEWVSRVVYDFSTDTSCERIVKFLEDLTLDLGIETGSAIDPFQVVLTTRIGDPNSVEIEDLKEEIKKLRAEIKRLEAGIKK